MLTNFFLNFFILIRCAKRLIYPQILSFTLSSLSFSLSSYASFSLISIFPSQISLSLPIGWLSLFLLSVSVSSPWRRALHWHFTASKPVQTRDRQSLPITISRLDNLAACSDLEGSAACSDLVVRWTQDRLAPRLFLFHLFGDRILFINN